MKSYPYRLEDFKNKEITINKNLETILSENISKELISKIGKFDFTFYFLKITISDNKKEGDKKISI